MRPYKLPHIITNCYKQLSDPDRKNINEINDIMNNTIDGWLPGPSTHRFGSKYGTQRAWHRKGILVNEDMPDKNEFISVSDDYVQERIPFD